MTSESAFQGQPGDLVKFKAAVDAAFGDVAAHEGTQARPDQVAKVREVIDTLREAPNARPSEALRSRALALYGERTPLLARWIASVHRIAMTLASPSQPALAGFRATETPLQTFHTKQGDLEAWLDLQVDREPGRVVERRLRGQVTIDRGVSAVGAVGVHAVETGSELVLASSDVDGEGRFTLRLDAHAAQIVDLVVELVTDGTNADEVLAVPGIVLRT